MPRVEEFASVAESINQMAEELDDKLRTLTHERNEREAVLSSMVEGVLAVDTDERVIAVNAAAARLLDTDPASAEGKTIQEVVRNPDLQHVVAQTLDGHRPVEADIVMRVGAEERNLQANGTLLHGDDDEDDVVGAVVVLNDVTRLKRLEAVRRDFVANVSHELKTPVTSIKGFAETLEDGALRRSGGGPPLRAYHRRAGRPPELDHRGPAGALDAGAVGRQPAAAAGGGRPLRRGRRGARGLRPEGGGQEHRAPTRTVPGVFSRASARRCSSRPWSTSSTTR